MSRINSMNRISHIPITPLTLSLSNASIATSTTSTNSDTTSSTTNSKSYNKFFNTFKSLFDIFDPERKGFIDLYELESLGANQNEILNDIISYLKDTYSTQSAQNNALNNDANISKCFFVTFDTFVNAADIVLKKRKMVKMLGKEMRHKSQKTLSDAFETAPLNTLNKTNQQETTLKPAFINHRNSDGVLSQPKVKSDMINLKNANSFDLSILIEQEFNLLKSGLNELDKAKRIFEMRLNDAKQKTFDINKLKHQNLFSIDKMLLNLNEIYEFNKVLLNFTEHNNHLLTNEQSDDDTKENILVSEATAIDDSDLIKRFDKFINEKQKRINYLQDEKSRLIRKLFEIKSNTYETSLTNTASEMANKDMEEIFFDNAKHEDYLFHQ